MIRIHHFAQSYEKNEYERNENLTNSDEFYRPKLL